MKTAEFKALIKFLYKEKICLIDRGMLKQYPFTIHKAELPLINIGWLERKFLQNRIKGCPLDKFERIESKI